MTFSSEQLARWTSGRWTSIPATPPTGFTMDSRALRAGELFVALKTARRDGHAFLAAAHAAGASAALVSHADPAIPLSQLVVADTLAAFQAIAREHRRTFTGPVVGISGSAGKTSTKNLVARLLGTPDTGEADQADAFSGDVLATAGNLNNFLGVPLTLTRLDPARHKFAVIEAGISEPGEMKPLAEMIQPDVSIITLVAPAHVAALGSLDGVAREKAVLPAATRPSGIAVFPRSCAEFAAFRDLSVRTLTVEQADVVLPVDPPRDRVYYTVTHRGDETAVVIAYPARGEPLVFSFRRVSDGMACNAVLAVCTALWLGVAPATIRSRLADWTPAALRGELRRDGDRLLYVDCYNANPASMLDALSAFAGMAPAEEPRLYILGCMEELGTEAEHHHRELGRRLDLRPGDRAYAIGAHAASIRAGALAANIPSDRIQIINTLDEIRPRFAAFRGAVFIKGSRRYRLEEVLAA